MKNRGFEAKIIYFAMLVSVVSSYTSLNNGKWCEDAVLKISSHEDRPYTKDGCEDLCINEPECGEFYFKADSSYCYLFEAGCATTDNPAYE